MKLREENLRKWGLWMKKVLFKCVCLLFAVSLLVGLMPMAVAMEWDLEVGGNYEERFYGYEPKVWNFTPRETCEYLLYTADSLMGEVVGQTPLSNAGLQPGYQVYKLTAGTTYQVKVQLKETYSAPYSDIFRLEKKEPLQSLNLSCTDYTGRRDETDCINAEWYPAYYSMDGLSWHTSDSSVVSIESAYDFTCNFRMNKVGNAVLTAKIGNLSASCNITVEKATGYWDDYPVWPAEQEQMNCSVTANQGAAFSYTPSQSGVYALHSEGKVHANIHGTSPSHILNERTAITLKGDYYLVDLIAGETYVIGVGGNYGDDGIQTGTVSIEKARTASSITLYGPNMTKLSGINGYVGGMQDVFPVTDPIYAFALTGGYTYSVSNSAMVELEQVQADGTNHLFLTQSGNCTLTVVTGNTKLVCPVTVKPSPVLEVGKTTALEFNAGDAYGVTCLFTPSSSGYYTFTIKGSGGTCYVEDTQIGNFIYGSGAMGGWLQGGQTYKVILGVGDSDHTVTVSGSGNVPPQDLPEPPKGDEPQEPEEPTDPIIPDEPEDPSDPSIPNEPADPSVPSEPTVPSEPSEPTVPENPTTPGEPSVTPELDELAQTMGGVYQDGAVRVDQADGDFTVSTEQLTQLVQSNALLVIRGNDVQVKLDGAALNAIAGQIQGDVNLQLRTRRNIQFNSQQKVALNGKTVAGSVSVALSGGNGEISGIEGGQFTVIVPLTSNLAASSYTVYRLSPEGEMEKVSGVVLADGVLRFETKYFADYVILEEAAEAATKQSSWLVPAVIVAAVVAAAGVAVFMLRKKK